MQLSSWRVRTKLSSKPSDALKCLRCVLSAWSMIWACGEQMGGIEMEGTDLHWPQTWEMALAPGSCLWPHSSPSVGSRLFFWEMEEACALLSDHHTIFIGGVSKDASTLEAPFWLFNETFNERNYGSKMFREPEDQTSMFQTAILSH